MSCPKSHSQLVCLQPFSNDPPSRPPDLTAQPSLPLRPAPDKSPQLDCFLSGLWLTCQSSWPSPKTVTLWLSSILEKIPELPGMAPQATSIQRRPPQHALLCPFKPLASTLSGAPRTLPFSSSFTPTPPEAKARRGRGFLSPSSRRKSCLPWNPDSRARAVPSSTCIQLLFNFVVQLLLKSLFNFYLNLITIL